MVHRAPIDESMCVRSPSECIEIEDDEYNYYGGERYEQLSHIDLFLFGEWIVANNIQEFVCSCNCVIVVWTAIAIFFAI